MVPNLVILGIFNMMQNYMLSLCMQLVSLNYYPLDTYYDFTQYFAFPYAQHFFERKLSIAKLFSLLMVIYFPFGLTRLANIAHQIITFYDISETNKSIWHELDHNIHNTKFYA